MINTIKELESFSKLIMGKGHFLFMKFDPERVENKISVIIDVPNNRDLKCIRKDGNDLLELVNACANEYHDNEL